MDLKQLAKEAVGQFVELVMIDGSTRRGTVQAPLSGMSENILPLLDEIKSTVVADGESAVSIEEYQKLVDLIPLRRVLSISKIETTIGGLTIKTQQGKAIMDDGMQVRLTNIMKPGCVGVSHKMPGAQAWSPEKSGSYCQQ